MADDPVTPDIEAGTCRVSLSRLGRDIEYVDFNVTDLFLYGHAYDESVNIVTSITIDQPVY